MSLRKKYYERLSWKAIPFNGYPTIYNSNMAHARVSSLVYHMAGMYGGLNDVNLAFWFMSRKIFPVAIPSD